MAFGLGRKNLQNETERRKKEERWKETWTWSILNLVVYACGECWENEPKPPCMHACVLLRCNQYYRRYGQNQSSAVWEEVSCFFGGRPTLTRVFSISILRPLPDNPNPPSFTVPTDLRSQGFPLPTLFFLLPFLINQTASETKWLTKCFC